MNSQQSPTAVGTQNRFTRKIPTTICRIGKSFAGLGFSRLSVNDMTKCSSMTSYPVWVRLVKYACANLQTLAHTVRGGLVRQELHILGIGSGNTRASRTDPGPKYTLTHRPTSCRTKNHFATSYISTAVSLRSLRSRVRLLMHAV